MRAVTLGALCWVAASCGDGQEPVPVTQSMDNVLPLDAGAADAVAAPVDACTPPTITPLPELRALSQLGLYSDLASKTIACDLVRYEPRFPLWSDGADKARWLRLPAGQQIDSSDLDHFRFPVGTLLFKEFARDGRRLETRVLMRVSAEQTFLGAFVWRDDESDADLVHEGATNVRGTDHDVPSDKQCSLCHDGEPGHVLGLSAIQGAPLPASSFTTELPDLTLPFDAPTSQAFGYLHANCGHCHHEGTDAWHYVPLTLRLSAYEREAVGTALYLNTVGTELFQFKRPGLTLRVAPRDPEASGLVARMLSREQDRQMPPIASKHVDPTGVALLRTWIDTL